MSAFDVFLRAMEIALAFFAAVAIALGIALVVLRASNSSRERHQSALERRWQALFSPTAAASSEFPAIEKDDRGTVLMVFNAFAERGPGPALDETARAIGLDVCARGLLAVDDDAAKIVALGTLGWLGDLSLVPEARKLMLESRSRLSFAAAQALLRLDPASIDQVVVQVRDRFGYVRARVESMFCEVGAEALDPSMQRVVAASDERGKIRLIEYIGCCSEGAARAICLSVVAETENPELLAAALRALAPIAVPGDVRLARAHVDDGLPFVRLAALRLLRATATPADAALLERLTSDGNWWVRQRAAEALVSLDGANAIALRVLESPDDPYASRAIAAAFAEQRTERFAGEIA